ncbi:MAG: hypothetical protein GWO10_17430, partial [candidate division Zixibacteria bacterium]|nr:hypothetical protein [Gammaproteobacteria bacterium]NIR65502.1 hypothetical protein [candidate division Zixibacteria bacterium]NIW98149.1 hypothetical protein [Phycisphaerae bacterium]
MTFLKRKFKWLLIMFMVLMLVGIVSSPNAEGAPSDSDGSIRVTLSVKAGYNIDREDSFSVIRMQDFAMTSSPGDPILPHKLHDILLPPNALQGTVKLNIVSAKTRTLDGIFDIKPAGPDAAWIGSELVKTWGDKNIVNNRNVDVYQSDTHFPKSVVKLLPCSQMRKWKYVRVDFNPFQYNPVSGTLTLTESVDVEISYGRATLAVDGSLMADTASDNTAARRFLNYTEARDWYNAAIPIDQPSPTTYDYVIITTNAIVANSTKLSNFVTHRQGLGYSVLVVTYENDIQSLTGQAPDNRAEKIRQWLINNYATMGIEYVLLIGDPHPYESGEGDIPMKMCHPEKHQSNADVVQTPTDYFYADLTGNWDIDGDQDYGEWDPDGNGTGYSGDFPVTGGVDFDPEVYVGRIPVYNNE